MKVVIVDNGTSFLKQLKELFSGNDVVFIDNSKISEIKSGTADLVVLSGGHSLPVMGASRPYSREIEFIRTSEIPILGICLGYELIAHAFGAKLRLMEQPEKGLLEIIPTREDQIFTDMEKFSVYESHRWIVENLPEELIGLAKSKDGFEIIRHKQKLVYGFQFHPEMVESNSRGGEIFRKFLDIIKS